MSLRVGLFASRVRVEEKLLLDAFARRGVEPLRIDPRTLHLPLDGSLPDPLRALDVVLDRSIAFGHSLYGLPAFEAAGIRCVNASEVVATAGDKARTTAALERAGVPTPRTELAFDVESALRACASVGYPAVLKPVVGSWGRLVARVPDEETARALLEHRAELGGWQHGIAYVQELIDKPGRDIRAFVLGDRCVAAIYRRSSDWITNTARGAEVDDCPVSPALETLAVRAADAVGGGILAVDLVEDREGRLLVLEVNHSMEFRNSIEPTGVDLPGTIVEHVLASDVAVVA